MWGGGCSTYSKVLWIQAGQGSQGQGGGCRLFRASGGARQGQGVGFPPPGMAMGRAGSVGSAWDVKAGKLGGGGGNHP